MSDAAPHVVLDIPSAIKAATQACDAIKKMFTDWVQQHKELPPELKEYEKVVAAIQTIAPTAKGTDPTISVALDAVAMYIDESTELVKQMSAEKKKWFSNPGKKGTQIANVVSCLESCLALLSTALKVPAQVTFSASKHLLHPEARDFWNAQFGETAYEAPMAKFLQSLTAAGFEIPGTSKSAMCLMKTINVFEFNAPTALYGVTHAISLCKTSAQAKDAPPPFAGSNIQGVHPPLSHFMQEQAFAAGRQKAGLPATPAPAAAPVAGAPPGMPTMLAGGRRVNWHAKPPPRPDSKYFYLTPNLPGNLVMDIHGIQQYGSKPGLQVIVAPFNPRSESQTFKIDKKGRLRNKLTGLAVDVSGKAIKGGCLILWQPGDPATQRWKIGFNGCFTNAAPVISPGEGNLVMDADITSANKNVIFWPWRGGKKPNQVWRMIFSMTAPAAPVPAIPEKDRPI
jgi:hypothetical protein